MCAYIINDFRGKLMLDTSIKFAFQNTLHTTTEPHFLYTKFDSRLEKIYSLLFSAMLNTNVCV